MCTGTRDDLRRIECRSEPLYKRRNWILYSFLERNGSFKIPDNLEKYTPAGPNCRELSREEDWFLLCEHVWILRARLLGNGRVPKCIW